MEESSMAVLIEASGLEKRFGDIVAVDGISLRVQQGEVLGFLGPNGAGKSTTMKMLTGFLAPDAGSARICGFDVLEYPKLAQAEARLPAGRRALLRRHDACVASSPSSPRSAASPRRGQAPRVAAAVEQDAAARRCSEQTIETLSKGFKRRVGLAQAILHDPRVLILDEPTDGLDPNQKHQVRKLIADMAADKVIIISTHILEEVDAVCTRAVIIAAAGIVADGTAEELEAPFALPPRRRAGRVGWPLDEAVAGAARFAAIAEVETLGAANGRCGCARGPAPARPSASELALADPARGWRGRGGARRARPPRRRVPQITTSTRGRSHA